MIQINLLPITERQSHGSIHRLFIVSAILISLLFISLYSYSIFEKKSMENKLQVTRNQYQLLQPTRSLMISANSKQQLMDKKQNIILELTNKRISLHAIIQHLTGVASSEIKFIDIAKDEKGNIKIKGWAMSYPDVAQFMEKIERDPFIKEWSVINIEHQATLQVTTFDLFIKPKGI